MTDQYFTLAVAGVRPSCFTISAVLVSMRPASVEMATNCQPSAMRRAALAASGVWMPGAIPCFFAAARMVARAVLNSGAAQARGWTARGFCG